MTKDLMRVLGLVSALVGVVACGSSQLTPSQSSGAVGADFTLTKFLPVDDIGFEQQQVCMGLTASEATGLLFTAPTCPTEPKIVSSVNMLQVFVDSAQIINFDGTAVGQWSTHTSSVWALCTGMYDSVCDLSFNGNALALQFRHP